MTESDDSARSDDHASPMADLRGESDQHVVSRNGHDVPRVQPLEPSGDAREGSAATYRDPKAESDHWRERAVLWRERAIAAELVVKVLQKHVDDLRANVRDLRACVAQDHVPQTPVVRDAHPQPTTSGLSAWMQSLQTRCYKLVDRYGPRPGTD